MPATPPTPQRDAVREPPVVFTDWTPWHERGSVPNAHLPGVYLLAHFDAAPPARVDPLAREIDYIGEVAEGSLAGRWQQFHRSAFEGKPGHTGGLLYREVFDEEDEGESLYVAAYVPQGLPRDLRTAFILYVERRLVWEWVRRWGGPPVCNRR